MDKPSPNGASPVPLGPSGVEVLRALADRMEQDSERQCADSARLLKENLPERAAWKDGCSMMSARAAREIRAALASAEGARGELAGGLDLPPDRFDCWECGPAIRVDDDGCCVQCGRDAIDVEGGLPVGPLRGAYSAPAAGPSLEVEALDALDRLYEACTGLNANGLPGALSAARAVLRRGGQ